MTLLPGFDALSWALAGLVLAGWQLSQLVGPVGAVPTGRPACLDSRNCDPQAIACADLYEDLAAALGAMRQLDSIFADLETALDPLDALCPDEIRAWWDQQPEAQAILHRLQRCPRVCFDPPPEPMTDAADAETIPLIRFLAADLSGAARALHDTDLALEAARTFEMLARHVARDPKSTLSVAAPQAYHGVAIRISLWPLAWGEMTPEQQRVYIRQVRSFLGPVPPLEPALIAERQRVAWWMTVTLRERLTIRGRIVRPRVGDLCPPQRVMGEYDRVFRVVLRIARLPIEQLCQDDHPLWRELGQRYDALVARGRYAVRFPFVNIPAYVARLVLVDYGRVLKRYALEVARDRAAAAIFAIHEYRAVHGRWPPSLDALDGGPFIDPFACAPFRYRQTEDGFVLYSVGPDGDDDGGRSGASHPVSATWLAEGERANGDLLCWPPTEW